MTLVPKDEHQTYLAKLEAEIESLQKRIDALSARIDNMKSIGAPVHAQVELLALMRVMARSLKFAWSDATRMLETGESPSSPRTEK